jgi:diacylglycerol kinase (CTP)
VIWYLVGAILVLHFLPLGTPCPAPDEPSFSRLALQISRPSPSSCAHSPPPHGLLYSRPASLSWADTAASTFGRLWGRRTRPLPARVPLLRLPLAPRKSLAGFAAASATGALAAVVFWRVAAPLRPAAPGEVSWSFDGGFSMPTDDVVGRALREAGLKGFKAGGWLGLGLIGLTAGVVSGIAEALGGPGALSRSCACVLMRVRADVGTWDDNLTLPVISGACLWAFFKLMSYMA